MKRYFNVLLLVILAMAIHLEAKDSDLPCGACHMLVDEISWEISQTDPKRTIQVGSFRIMPDGSQRLNEIPYKQSGVQISELLETACANPNDYYQSTDETTGRKVYKRQNRRDGQPASLRNVAISKETTKMLKFACEGIAEDYDEEITRTFKNKEDENYLHNVCVQVAEVCSEDQLYDVNPEVADETAEESGEDDSEEDSDEDSEESSESDSDMEEGSNESETHNRSEL